MFLRFMGPEESKRRSAVQTVLFDPLGRHTGARVAGQRHRCHHGLLQHGMDTGEHLIYLFKGYVYHQIR